jgi:IS605 OrfB family transposase
VLKEDQKNDAVRICFGSKKLFRAQFALEDNGYNSHDEWLKDWQAARNNQFFGIGSKDETAGCQGCVATVVEDGSISLRLRVPNEAGQKHTVITGLRFAHGHDAIVAAIGRNLSKDKQDWQAISYRFLKDAKGWRVFVSVSLPEVKRHSEKRLGVIGVDINEDFLAVTETDRYGNPVATWTIPCCTYGKSSEQSRAIIGKAMNKLMAIATPRHKPLALEELNFSKKKALLENSSPKYARMLSSFAYTQIQTVIRSRAFDMGIEVLDVNPAYTSVIGEYKFAKKYGLSVHHAAALVIGRRTLGLSETLPSQLHVTLPLPARNRSRHVWSKWAAVSRADAKAKAPRKAPAALAAHSRPGKHPRSTPAPVFDKARSVTMPSVAGAIPACESSLELFG